MKTTIEDSKINNIAAVIYKRSYIKKEFKTFLLIVKSQAWERYLERQKVPQFSSDEIVESPKFVT